MAVSVAPKSGGAGASLKFTPSAAAGFADSPDDASVPAAIATATPMAIAARTADLENDRINDRASCVGVVVNGRDSARSPGAHNRDVNRPDRRRGGSGNDRAAVVGEPGRRNASEEDREHRPGIADLDTD